MSLKSILQDVGKFFTSKPVEETEQIAIPALEDVFPGLTPLLTGLAAVVGTVESSAQQTYTTPDQIVADATTLADQVYAEYEAAKGISIPAPNKAQILALIVQILEQIPQVGAEPSTGPAAATTALPIDPGAVVKPAPTPTPGFGGGATLTQSASGEPLGTEAVAAAARPKAAPDDSAV
jgi:hypothetical protein